jgi:hypothetical protein
VTSFVDDHTSSCGQPTYTNEVPFVFNPIA